MRPKQDERDPAEEAEERRDAAEKSEPRFRTRDEACAYVRLKHGAPLSPSTADKLAALGEFARVAAWWGRRPLYADPDLDAWVEARLRRDADNAPALTSKVRREP